MEVRTDSTMGEDATDKEHGNQTLSLPPRPPPFTSPPHNKGAGASKGGMPKWVPFAIATPFVLICVAIVACCIAWGKARADEKKKHQRKDPKAKDRQQKKKNKKQKKEENDHKLSEEGAQDGHVSVEMLETDRILQIIKAETNNAANEIDEKDNSPTKNNAPPPDLLRDTTLGGVDPPLLDVDAITDYNQKRTSFSAHASDEQQQQNLQDSNSKRVAISTNPSPTSNSKSVVISTEVTAAAVSAKATSNSSFKTTTLSPPTTRRKSVFLQSLDDDFDKRLKGWANASSSGFGGGGKGGASATIARLQQMNRNKAAEPSHCFFQSAFDGVIDDQDTAQACQTRDDAATETENELDRNQQEGISPTAAAAAAKKKKQKKKRKATVVINARGAEAGAASQQQQPTRAAIKFEGIQLEDDDLHRGEAEGVDCPLLAKENIIADGGGGGDLEDKSDNNKNREEKTKNENGLLLV